MPWLDAKLSLLDSGSVPNLVPGIIDTARAYFDLENIAIKDKAFAAYVIANAYAEVNNLEQALQWAREAARLEPDSRAYAQLVRDLSRGRQ
jgi:tetratricopeptide (TPR) repeat protein